MPKLEAAIFDLNGTIIDDGPYHDKAWRAYAKKLGFDVSSEEFKNKMWGKNNEAILTYLFKKPLERSFIEKHAEDKEALYREIYKPYLKEIPGLSNLLKELKEKGVKLGVATSAPLKNLDFTLDGLKIRKYFDAIVDDSQLTYSKPHPEVFLKTAEKLKVHPENCVVFEDSLFGFGSAKAAGMKIVGITTSFTKEKLRNLGVPLIIGNFSEVRLQDLEKLLMVTEGY
ncbi:MAG: HAD family phosphatase [Candidatus Saganbacteria bacterium]|nr:HAD family phosphatase [Candidatus Saganbacteria bacterium]